jgi:hypothetical protein
VANIDDLVTELANAYRVNAILKRDTTAQISSLKSENAELAEQAEALKRQVKQAHALAAQRGIHGREMSQYADQHARHATKAAAALVPLQAELDTERSESAKLRARLAQIARTAEGKS